jgi:hypothetical protein
MQSVAVKGFVDDGRLENQMLDGTEKVNVPDVAVLDGIVASI